jgi:hypothetical protein
VNGRPTTTTVNAVLGLDDQEVADYELHYSDMEPEDCDRWRGKSGEEVGLFFKLRVSDPK